MARSQDSGNGATVQPGVTDPDIPEETEDDIRIYGAALSLGKMGIIGDVVKMSPAQRKALGYPEAGPIAMADMYGFARNVTEPKKLPRKDGDTEDKFMVGIVGDFEGRNLATGEFYAGGVLWCPSGHHDRILEDVKYKLAQSPGGQVRLDHRYIVVPDSNLSGFSWKAISKTPISKHDPLLAMRRESVKLPVEDTLKRISIAPAVTADKEPAAAK